ncbi:hypothetical protein [Planktothrix sp.]|uniref:hypothetical protein n=1 Tax=Planktothrix sp. TaxID=3088171 RepID=UPI0038D3747A
MINCSLFPSVLKPLNSCQNNQVRKTKFWIGDYVEAQMIDGDGFSFWERGIIRGILGYGWHWNTTKDEWLYYYEITETSYALDCKGKTGKAFEDELRLIRQR